MMKTLEDPCGGAIAARRCHVRDRDMREPLVSGFGAKMRSPRRDRRQRREERVVVRRHEEIDLLRVLTHRAGDDLLRPIRICTVPEFTGTSTSAPATKLGGMFPALIKMRRTAVHWFDSAIRRAASSCSTTVTSAEPTAISAA